MSTYLELKEQAEKLLAQAEQVRQKEVEQAIADIKQKMNAYGLTPQDLGLRVGGGRAAAKRTSAQQKSGNAVVKYRGPNNETWSGGRGRKPNWVTAALASGRKLEEFAVK